MSATAPISSPPLPREGQWLTLVAKVDAHEGPVYVPGEDALYFTTLPQRDRRRVPSVQIKRLPLDGARLVPASSGVLGEPTVVRADANAANGMALSRDGRLICEQGTPATSARITVFNPGPARSRRSWTTGAAFP